MYFHSIHSIVTHMQGKRIMTYVNSNQRCKGRKMHNIIKCAHECVFEGFIAISTKFVVGGCIISFIWLAYEMANDNISHSQDFFLEIVFIYAVSLLGHHTFGCIFRKCVFFSIISDLIIALKSNMAAYASGNEQERK